MKGLIWFRHDLRLSDNPALISLSKHCNQALMLFVINPDWFKTNIFHSRHMGYFREAFLYQTLRELDADLKKYNQRLTIKVGDPLVIIPELCKKHGIDLVTLNEHSGVIEKKQADYLQDTLPSTVQRCDSHTLFLNYQLKFDKDNFPRTFDLFRDYVTYNNLFPCIPISAPDSFPNVLKESNDDWRDEHFFQPLAFYHGGEDAALMRLKEYFWKTAGLQHYKQAKSDLEGIHTTSRFSAWLANGSVSVRNVAAALDKYEYRYGDDESSQAMYAELLRREYYQWKWMIFGASLLEHNEKKEVFDHEAYKSWQQGKTRFPIVNACMRQLNHVGYLSSLGRKIVASCLINELDIDWRYGAAYLEQQFIDFDAAINYCCWRELVGIDPASTGEVYCDIEQYTRDYDPDGKFIARWTKVLHLQLP